MRALLLTFLGFVSLGLGIIGLVLPVWPTTPFVLVSVSCFSSSPRLKKRLLSIPFLKEQIDNYEKRTGLSAKAVRFNLFWLWGMLLLSVLLIGKIWMTGFLLLVGSAVTIHILWMARPKDKGREAE